MSDAERFAAEDAGRWADIWQERAERAEAEVARYKAAIEAATKLCDEAERDPDYFGRHLTAAAVRAALVVPVDDQQDEPQRCHERHLALVDPNDPATIVTAARAIAAERYGYLLVAQLKPEVMAECIRDARAALLAAVTQEAKPE